MPLRSVSIEWTLSFTYFDAVFNVGRKQTVDIYVIKRTYTARNFLLGNTYSLNEMLRMNLQDSNCLPILQYATAVVKLRVA